ncbi:MAG: DUF3108 domain-containing protein [Zoogloea sp.]|nr:DUF3108 domain-containing protein [Zoogloea sp.]
MNSPAKRNRIFLAALVVSILVHALALFAPGWQLPTSGEKLPPLEARLEPMPAPSPVAEEPPEEAKKAPQAGPSEDLDRVQIGTKPAPKPQPHKRPAKPDETQEATGPKPEDEDAAPPADTSSDKPGEPRQADVAPAAAPPVPAPAPAPASAPADVPGRTEGWADRGKVQYDVIRGQGNFVIGRTTHEWKHDRNHYTMETVIETTGLVSLFKPFRMVQRSEGKVLPNGLKPEKFRVTRDGELREKADFDWSTAHVALVANGRERDVPIAEGDQDVLSLIHQLGLDPGGSGQEELLVVTGKSASRSVIKNLGLEEISVPAGRVTAYHLASQGQRGELQIDIWLARDYANLPVRIRITDRSGEVLDQVATGVELSGTRPAKIK